MTQFDAFLLLALAGAFVVGFFQGFIRGLMSVAAWLVAFLLAAHLREPLGSWLNTHWTQFDLAYNEMLAFVLLYAVILGALLLAVQVAYRHTRYARRHQLVDELVGGALASGATLLSIAGAVVAVDTFYGHPTTTQSGIWLLQGLHDGWIGSVIGETLGGSLVVGLGAILDPLLPDAVSGVMG